MYAYVHVLFTFKAIIVINILIKFYHNLETSASCVSYESILD